MSDELAQLRDELAQLRDDFTAMSANAHGWIEREREWQLRLEALERRESLPMCPACGTRASIMHPVVTVSVWLYERWRPYRCPQGHHFMIPVPLSEL